MRKILFQTIQHNDKFADWLLLMTIQSHSQNYSDWLRALYVGMVADSPDNTCRAYSPIHIIRMPEETLARRPAALYFYLIATCSPGAHSNSSNTAFWSSLIFANAQCYNSATRLHLLFNIFSLIRRVYLFCM